jgi:hypothetical protein
VRKIKQKVHEMSIPETKRRNRQKVQRVITPEQRKALDEEYYGFFRGAVGQKTLWTSFNENNERQKASLSDDNKSAWVPWRTLQLWRAHARRLGLLRRSRGFERLGSVRRVRYMAEVASKRNGKSV